MDDSKLDLSPQALRWLTEREPWDERRRLIDSLYGWFGGALQRTKHRHAALFNALVAPAAAPGKITRGDNYRGFPYVLLDYPNRFSHETILAARNMVWLGNDFHCTLHLRGKPALDAADRLFKSRLNVESRLYVCHSPDEWLHHVDPVHWVAYDDAMQDKSKPDDVLRRGWLKLGAVIDIRRPGTWNERLDEVYSAWARVLRNDHQPENSNA